MITIARYSKSEDAHLLRLRLEAGGVPAYIQDENTIQWFWYYSNAIGGMRVQISEDDVNAARGILLEPPVADVAADAPACPKCGAPGSVRVDLPRRLALLTLMIFSLPFPFSRNQRKCPACGHTWKES